MRFKTPMLAGVAGALALIISELAKGSDLRRAVDIALETTARHRDHHETTDALQAAITLALDGESAPEKLEGLGQGWIAEASSSATGSPTR